MGIEQLLGKSRVNKFRAFTADSLAELHQGVGFDLSDQNIFALYLHHWSVVSDLYIPMHIIEIVIRNMAHAVISSLLQDKKWMLSITSAYERPEETYQLRENFDKPLIVKHLEEHLTNSGTTQAEKIQKFIDRVFKAKRGTLRANDKISEDDLIANAEFGFWTTLMSSEYHSLSVRNHFFYEMVFDTELPVTENNIRLVCSKLKKLDHIRKIRNRLYHYDFITQDAAYKIIEEIKEILAILMRKNHTNEMQIVFEHITTISVSSRGVANEFVRSLMLTD